MSKRKVIIGVAAFVLITVLVGQSLCSSGARGGGQRPQRGGQQGQAGGGQRGARTGARSERGQMTRNYEQMQEMMLERMKTQIKVSDAKWPTVKPLLKKVRTLREQISPRFGGMMFGRGGMGGMGPGGRGGMGPGGRGGMGPGGRGGVATDTPQTAIDKATDNLGRALRAEAPKADDIKAKLAALRAAKAKAKKDLAKAESDLKAQLTTEQEANLVLMGQID